MIHRPVRRSARLAAFDYSTTAAYFVTAVTQHRLCVFGDRDTAEPNAAGRIVAQQWQWLEDRFPTIELDEFVVMPNHVHGIVLLLPSGDGPARTLSDVIGAFKSLTTLEYGRGVRQCGWMPFEGKLWQRSYHEHVIRGRQDLAMIREYIVNNSRAWELDAENPRAATRGAPTASGDLQRAATRAAPTGS